MFILAFVEVQAQNSILFNSSNDLNSHFDGDDTPTISYNATAGLGGSGALVESSNSPELWVHNLSNAYELSIGTHSVSAFFQFNGSCNGCRVGLGWSVLTGGPEVGNGLTYGGLGGFWEVNGNQVLPGVGERYGNNYSLDFRTNAISATLTPGNWYQMVFTMTRINATDLNLTSQIYASDANGNVGALLATYDWQTVQGGAYVTYELDLFSHMMPYFAFDPMGGSSNAINTMDNFSFNTSAPNSSIPACSPFSSNFDAASDLASLYNSFGASPSFSGNAGLGGSGAFVETTAGFPGSIFVRKTGFPRGCTDYTSEIFFKVSNSGSNGDLQVGFTTVPIPTHLNPSIRIAAQLSGTQAGRLGYINGEFANSISNANFLTNPLVPGNWYQLKLDAEEVANDQWNLIVSLSNSDANGVVGATIQTYTQTVTNSFISNGIEIYPYFSYYNSQGGSPSLGINTFDNPSATSGSLVSAAVPTVSQWGLIILALLVMNIGAIVLWRRGNRRELAG